MADATSTNVDHSSSNAPAAGSAAKADSSRPSSPPRPPLGTIAVATITSCLALVALVAVGTYSGYVLLIPPMAASMALVAGAPHLPLAQPRNVVGGQVVSAIVGSLVGLLGHSVWLSAIAGGLALGAMLLTRTSHSPAAATAVIGSLAPTNHDLRFVLCAGVAAAILVVFGVARARITGINYPTYIL